jgi:hypothetical protein
MKFYKIGLDTVLTHAREGRITLQVPTLTLDVQPGANRVVIDNVNDRAALPDNYFIRQLSNGRPTTRESNVFVFLSRTGFAGLKDRLADAYLKAMRQHEARHGTSGYDDKSDEFVKNVYITEMEKRLDERDAKWVKEAAKLRKAAKAIEEFLP